MIFRGGPWRNWPARPCAELLRAALHYSAQYRDVGAILADPAAPVLVAGHQPQLFHPGVWYKNFLLSALAGRHAGTAVNLVIDSDTIKTAALRVPGGTALEPLVESVPLDRSSAEIPYEERGVLDPCLLRSFAVRARALLGSLVPRPLLDEFWPLVVERAAAGATLGECFSQARHLQEGRWGASTLELPQSRVCELESFAWFTCHLLAELPRVHVEYNAAVAEYRRANHVRSLAHPVPDLAIDDGWLEAPYWIWSRDNPRRRRLFARRVGHEIELTDRRGLGVRLTLAGRRRCRPSGGTVSPVAAGGGQAAYTGAGDDAFCPIAALRPVRAWHWRCEIRSGDRSVDFPSVSHRSAYLFDRHGHVAVAGRTAASDVGRSPAGRRPAARAGIPPGATS